MSFLEYIKLQEEGEGGGESSGVDTSPVDNSTVDNSEVIPQGNSVINIANRDYVMGYYSRINMPQITKNLYNEFISDLSIKNINHTKLSIKKSELQPTQHEFNNDKVNSIRADMNNGKYTHTPLLVSNDNCIVDGHHRWAAHNDSSDIGVHQVDLSFEALYDFLQNKPYVLNRTVDNKEH